MVPNLNGIVFDQVYPDNSGGAEFDTDGDGTTTQEDEFISVRNTGTEAVDLSGYEIWSEGKGANAPDEAREGLFHQFPEGTVLEPGDRLWIVNEFTGPVPDWAQEASEGGLESGAGGVSTNILGEGYAGNAKEAVALVDPDSGDYIVFNKSKQPSEISTQPGFTGTNSLGEFDGHAVQNDPAAGFSYQYNPAAQTYTYGPAFVPCIVAGSLIGVPGGEVPIETLRPGDLVLTRDRGAVPLKAVLVRDLVLAGPAMAPHKPIRFGPGSLGAGTPSRALVVSPQHRMLVQAHGAEALAPAKALLGWRGVRRMTGRRTVRYVQLVLDAHDLICADGAWVETFYPGRLAITRAGGRARRTLRHALGRLWPPPPPARPFLTVRRARLHARPA